LERGWRKLLRSTSLRVPDQLRRSLASTNLIESAFSVVETVCRNVKRWRNADQIERLGRLRAVGGGTAVPQGDRLSTDPDAAFIHGECSFQEARCERSRSGVIYMFRESLTFNGIPGNVRYGTGSLQLRGGLVLSPVRTRIARRIRVRHEREGREVRCWLSLLIHHVSPNRSARWESQFSRQILLTLSARNDNFT